MRRNNFKKALKHIESRSVDKNIARLNGELKKTGMLSEKMTTSTVLPPTETQPYIPPTISNVPDTSGLLGNSFSQPTNGGDEDDSSTWQDGWPNNDYLKNPDDLSGETDRPILAQVNATYPYDDGGGTSTIVFGSIAFGTSVGVISSDNIYRQILVGGLIGGTNRPTEESRGSGGIYRSLSDAEFNYAVSVYEKYSELNDKRLAGELETGVLNVWKVYSRFHDGGGSFEGYTGVKKSTGDYPQLILIGIQYFKEANTYTSDPGQPRTTVLNRLEDPSSPDFYEGDFSKYLRNLLDLSGRAFDYLDQKALENENLIAGFGLRPDGSTGWNTPGDVNRGHDGTLYKLVPRPGYGYNMWVPLKMAQHMPTDAGDYTDQDDPINDGPFPDDPFDDSDFEDPFPDLPLAADWPRGRPGPPPVYAPWDKGWPSAPGGGGRPFHPPIGPQPNYPMAKKGGKKKKQSVVSHHEPQGDVLSEGWQSPDHTNVEKDPKTRWFSPNAGTDSAKWFDPKEVKPIYPEEPPKMIDGYNAKSNLAPKLVDKSPAIKLTKKDLLRNHRLKDSEIEEMMRTINRINKFIADHPEELIYAKSRYPKNDLRLAELNWKMDQMLNASNEYLDKQFPENERLFNRLKSATQKTIELTDPETYKKDPGKLTSMGNLAKVDSVMNHYVPKDRVVSKIKVEKKKSVNRFFVKPKRPDRPAYLRKKRKDTPSQ